MLFRTFLNPLKFKMEILNILVVPRGYLSGEDAAINWIAEEFQSIDKDQVKLDDV